MRRPKTKPKKVLLKTPVCPVPSGLPEDVIKVDIEVCPRCKFEHSSLKFSFLLNSVLEEYWAQCPLTQQPITIGFGKKP